MRTKEEMEKRDKIFEEYESFLNSIGFGDYMIDFSDVSTENVIKICQYIKTLVENKK